MRSSLSVNIAVEFQRGRRGTAALDEAAALAARSGAKLAVVAVAPQASAIRCSGPSPEAYNGAVRDAVAEELREAAQLLGAAAEGASFVMLVEGRDPPLRTWAEQGGFELVRLPARRKQR